MLLGRGLIDRGKLKYREVRECVFAYPDKALLSQYYYRKVIVDECFWNPYFSDSKPYFCGVSSNPTDLVVYNNKGRRLKIKESEIYNSGR
jgi:hypothetical protein